MINPDERLTILASKHVSRGKMAAAAVHAALMHYGIPHGAVIVLGASPGRIEGECSLIIRDAGRTEVEPGTVTAGVRKGEDDAQRHALLDAATERDRLAEAVREVRTHCAEVAEESEAAAYVLSILDGDDDANSNSKPPLGVGLEPIAFDPPLTDDEAGAFLDAITTDEAEL